MAAVYTNQDWPGAFAEDARGVLVSVTNNLYRVDRRQLVPYVFTNGQAALPVDSQPDDGPRWFPLGGQYQRPLPGEGGCLAAMVHS